MFAGYKKDHDTTVGDVIQVKLWTNGSTLVVLNKFGVYTIPHIFDITAKSITVNQDSEAILELIADAPIGVTLASKNDTAFADMTVDAAQQVGTMGFPFNTGRLFQGEFVQDLNTPFENVVTTTTSVNLMFAPVVEGFNLLRVSV
jgi:hypothetical protein